MRFIEMKYALILAVVLGLSACNISVNDDSSNSSNSETVSETENQLNNETDNNTGTTIGLDDVSDISDITVDGSIDVNGEIDIEVDITDDQTDVVVDETADDQTDVVIDDTSDDDVPIEIINNFPVAKNDSLMTQEDTVLSSIDVLANDADSDGDTLTILQFSQGVNGGSVEQTWDGKFIFTPAKDYFGNDEFTYVIGDGNGGEATATVNINIESVNDIAVVNEEYTVNEDSVLTNIDLLANDKDIDGGKLSLIGYTQGAMGGVVQETEQGTLSYFPVAEFNGKDEFFYIVSDGQGGVATGMATVWVENVNDTPIALPDTYVMKQFETQELMLLDNDSGLGDGVEISLVSNPENGTSVITENGTVIYTPTDDYFGLDSFIYKLTDSNGDETIATVSINVECDGVCGFTAGLSWEPSMSYGVVGYKLYVGTAPNQYDEVVELDDVTEFEYFTKDEGTYYFAISAVNFDNIESELTEEVSVTF